MSNFLYKVSLRVVPGLVLLGLLGLTAITRTPVAHAQDSSYLLITPTAAINAVGGSQPVVMTLQTADANGQPAPEGVTITISGPDSANFVLSTGSNGQASFELSGVSGPGTDTVTGSFTDSQGQNVFSSPSEIIWMDYSSIVLSPSSSNNVVGNQQTLNATVTGMTGQPGGGIPVTFFVSSGPDIGEYTATANSSGVASIALTGALGPGTDVVTANFIDGVNQHITSNTATINWTAPDLSSLTISPATTSDPVGSSQTLTATAIDANGQPASNMFVEFTVSSGPDTGKYTTETNASGVGTIKLSDMKTAGTDVMIANFADSLNNIVTSNQASITWNNLIVTANAVSAYATLPFSGTVATVANAIGTPTAATINWGDGHTSPGTVTPSGANAYNIGGTHTYKQQGTYTMTVSVVMPDGSTQSATATATVSTIQMTVLGATISVKKGSKFSEVIGTLNEPAGAPLPVVTISWGDGTSSKAVLTATGTGTYSITGTHTYHNVGMYTVVIKAQITRGPSAKGTGTAHVS